MTYKRASATMVATAAVLLLLTGPAPAPEAGMMESSWAPKTGYFAEADTDKDGVVDAYEHSEYLRSAPCEPPCDRRQLFNEGWEWKIAADTNNDGFLTAEEARQAAAGRSEDIAE